MKQLLIGALLAFALAAGLLPATAQSVPSVKGLTAFTPQCQYMSVTGYLRWQYFQQNHTWISLEEANELVKSQL